MEIGKGLQFVSAGDPAAAHFTKASFTTDGSAHDLDISSIVGKGVKLVLIHVYIQDDAVNSWFAFMDYNITNLINANALHTQVANIDIEGDMWALCSKDGVVRYAGANVVFTVINVTVRGWLG